jgi:hypothetical protein
MPEESHLQLARNDSKVEIRERVLMCAAGSQTRLASLSAFAKISLLLVGE